MIPRFLTVILFFFVPGFLGISSSLGYSAQGPFLSDVRKQVRLNGEWSFKKKGDESWQKIDLPASTDEVGTLFFRRSFRMPAGNLMSNYILVFEGINFASRIKLNDQFISTQAHGFTLVSVPIPNDLIRQRSDNVLEVEVETRLTNRSIPLDHALFSPVPLRGIFRDIYMVVLPPISINSMQISPSIDDNMLAARVTGRVRLDIDDSVSQTLAKDPRDSLITVGFVIREEGAAGREITSREESLSRAEALAAPVSFDLRWQNPKLWSQKSPDRYILETSVLHQGKLVDRLKAPIGLRSLDFVDNDVRLNGSIVPIQGIGFLEDKIRLLNRDNTLAYLEKIKSLGFNTISWFSPPPAHALNKADSLGLFSLLKVPIWNVPGPVLMGDEFQLLAASILEKLNALAASYPSVLAISLGEGFDPESGFTHTFIQALANSENRSKSLLLTAGFRDFHHDLQSLDLDFISFNVNIHRQSDWRIWQAKWTESGSSRPILFTDLAVPYVAPHPDSENISVYEARQAYNLKAIINEIQRQENLGFVLSSLFDWKITYPTTLSFPSADFRIVPFGLSTYEEFPRMSMNMMQNVNRGTGYQFKFQPIPSEQFDTVFIIYGLVIIVAFLFFFRRDHRFRGNFIRLLFRPFGFYAELKDGRIIPWFVTILCLIPSASSWGILTGAIFTFLRNHPLFDFMISQTAPAGFLHKMIIFMTWHPLIGLIGFTIFAGLIFSALALYVFFLSVSTGHRLSIRSALTFVYWEGCIFVFLLPVAFVSYRIYAIPSIRLILFIILAVFVIWYFYRLIVGIMVIFEFKPALTAILFIGVPLIVLFFIGSLYNHSRGLSAHLNYLYHLWKLGL